MPVTLSRRWTVALWLLAAAFMAWRTHSVVWTKVGGNCLTMCSLLVQLRALREGLPAWAAGFMVGLDPTCPTPTYAMYQPTFLHALAPWVVATGAQACAVWPWVQELTWLGACAAAAWTFRSQGPLYLVLLTWLLPVFDDPLGTNVVTGALGTVEALLLWLALAAAVRGAWGANVLLSFALGSAKVVYWMWLALALAAGRLRWLAAGLVACAAWVVIGFAWGAEGAFAIWHNAQSHDERLQSHPALRGWVFDQMSLPTGAHTLAEELPWMIPMVVVLTAVMVWIWRRKRPTLDADAIGMFALAHFAVTPYLKDYGLVLVLPVIAWALLRVRWWLGLALYATIAWTHLGGDYHVLACLWLCGGAVAAELARGERT